MNYKTMESIRKELQPELKARLNNKEILKSYSVLKLKKEGAKKWLTI